MSKIGFTTRDFSVRAIAAAVAMGLSASVLAEPMFQVPLTRESADMTRYDSDYVEIGGGYQSEDSYKFGEFSGLVDKGGFIIGNFNARKRIGDSAGYLNAWGYNLGQTSRQLGIEGGQQGKYWLSAGYEQLTRYQYDDAYFIHRGLGSSNLTLPGFGGITAGGSQPPANAAAINSALVNFDIKQERDVAKLGGGFYLGSWKFSLDYRQDDLNGSKEIGAVMGNTGGNPRSVIVPYELDAKIYQIEARASWQSKQGQFNLTYWYSKYDNNATSLTWENPYSTIGGWVAGTGWPTGSGRLGLMPTNDSWQVQATGAWNFTPTMRLTGTLSYGVMSQDEAFQPYTVNNAQIATPTALPRASLDGEIKNTLFDLTYTWRPTSKSSLKAQYQYQKHDNNTPVNTYLYVGGDTTVQPTPASCTTLTADSGRCRTNVPPGLVENKVLIDYSYQIIPRTMLRGWYQYTKLDYEEANDELRSDTNNNQFGVELRRIMSESFTGALKYVYDQRRGSDFSTFRPYAASYSPATVNNSQLDNIPTTRQFFVADYDKNLLQLTGTWSPLDRTTFGLRADYYTMNFKGPNCGGQQAVVTGVTWTYPDQCLGRNSADGGSFTLDASYAVAEGWNTFAFYTYQKYGTEQSSRTFNNAAASVNTNNNWGVNMNYSDNTFGLGVNFKPASKKWDAGLLYTYNNGTGVYEYLAGPGVTPIIPVPDTTVKSNQVQLYAKWQYSKNLLFRFNYWYQNLRTNDWAYDGLQPASSSNVVLTGQQSPNYNVNTFGFSVAYTNW